MPKGSIESNSGFVASDEEADGRSMILVQHVTMEDQSNFNRGKERRAPAGITLLPEGLRV